MEDVWAEGTGRQRGRADLTASFLQERLGAHAGLDLFVSDGEFDGAPGDEPEIAVTE